MTPGVLQNYFLSHSQSHKRCTLQGVLSLHEFWTRGMVVKAEFVLVRYLACTNFLQQQYVLCISSLHELLSVECTMYSYLACTKFLEQHILCTYRLCAWDNSGTEGNFCKANSSTEGNSCNTNSTIFEHASEIFSCKPNKYGSF